MTIRVKLFAVAKQIAESDVFDASTSGPISLAELRKQMVRAFPAFDNLLPHVRFAVNASYASDDTIVTENDEIAIIPPVSGG
jgi:molybdopterin converting factor small subunit